MPLISVIVPAYNTKNYLDNCIESIVKQRDFSDFEVLLVDDGSTDGTATICDKWARRDKRVRVFHQKNQGQSHARNYAIEKASGEYIAFVDSDDVIHPSMYSSMLAVFEKEKNCHLVLCGLERFQGQAPVFETTNKEAAQVFTGPSLVASNIQYPMLGCVNGETPVESSSTRALYYASIIHAQHLRFVNTKKYGSEDLIFNFQYLAHCNKAAILPQAFYLYRSHASSWSHRYDPERIKALKEMVTVLYAESQKQKIPPSEYLPRIANKFLEHISVYAKQVIISLKWSKARKELQKMREEDVLISSLGQKAWKKSVLSMHIFCSLMEKKWYFLLQLLVKIYFFFHKGII